MSIIKQMLDKYEINSEGDIVNALKDIFQEITLLGLYRGGFFHKAAFYGGTSLRVLYGLNRFSEDLKSESSTFRSVLKFRRNFLYSVS